MLFPALDKSMNWIIKKIIENVLFKEEMKLLYDLAGF
jgi:hypothetical protein